MDRIGQTLAQKAAGRPSLNPDELMKVILADQEVADFITSHQLTQNQIKISLPKFNQYINERSRFQNHDQAYIAKGYEPILVMNEGFADVSYLETKELIESQKKQAISDRINLVSLPRSYKHISFDDINLDDVKRLDVFQAIVDFVGNYPDRKSVV